MKRSNIGFPYPVLSFDNNDYVDCAFSIQEMKEITVENGEIILHINYQLVSAGLQELLNKDLVEVLLYIESATCSYRKIFKFQQGERAISLTLKASDFAKNIKIKGLVIAKGDIDSFCFEEHNRDLFEGFVFKVHNGDILAISNILEGDIGLLDPLSNKPSIFSIRPDDTATQAIRVDLNNPDKINIWLKRDLHNEYQDLREESKIRILLASYFVLPALIEAIEFMKTEALNGDYEDLRNGGWYQSLDNRLKSLHIDLSEEFSLTSVANRILNDIVQEAMNNFKFIKENLAGGN